MVAARSARGEALFEDIESWMERRNAQVGQFARDAEAAGRKVWDDATRAGQNVLARTQGELAALGSQLQSKRGNAAPARSAKKSISKVGPDLSLTAKVAGASAANLAGIAAGLGEGVWHSAEGLGQGLLVLSRLADPDDAELNGPDQSAWGQVVHAGNGAFDYIKKGVADPASVGADIRHLGQKLYVDTVPSATPMADTFGGEVRRNFELGRNQGERDWDIGSLLFGGSAVPKTTRALGIAAEATGPSKFLEQGFSPAQADYLAAPYDGMGHHFVQRWVGRAMGLPKEFMDIPFNVVKPPILNRGDFYELHYRVDPYFNAANLPKDVGGGTWKGNALGIKRDNPWRSLLTGSPAPLNVLVGAAGATDIGNSQSNTDEPQ